jgi:hypothetical protein
MGDEQRVSWQELLAQSRDDFEAGTDFTLAVTFRSVEPFVGMHNKASSVAAMRVSNPNRSPLAINGCNDFSVTGTIFLTSGQLVVDTSITISGPGANMLAVDGSNNSRVFRINSGNTVTISGLTITNGNAGDGSGIYNDRATLTVSDCTVSGNTVLIANLRGGGGIWNNGQNGNATLSIDNSTVSRNSAGSGGGITNRGGTVNLNGSSNVNHNTATNAGGGILNRGTVNQNNSSAVNWNTASDGGGIYNFGGTLNQNGGSVLHNSPNDIAP